MAPRQPAALRGVVAEFLGLTGKLNGQQLIKTGDAPPPLSPTPRLKPPANPLRSLPPPLLSSTYRGLVLVSLFFFFSYLSFSPVQCFCLNDGSHWVIQIASLPPLFGLKAARLMTGTTCRQENVTHVTSPWL